MNTDGTGFHTCKECHKTESLWNHTTTDHKDGEQLEDRRSVGASSCNSGDGTDQRVQSLMFMMLMMVISYILLNKIGSYFNSLSILFHYPGADKSLARAGRNQARKHVRDARDFNNMETRTVIIFFYLQGKARKEIYTILVETLACFLPGRAKDLSAPLYITAK